MQSEAQNLQTKGSAKRRTQKKTSSNGLLHGTPKEAQ
jgi:hypothetical protein